MSGEDTARPLPWHDLRHTLASIPLWLAQSPALFRLLPGSLAEAGHLEAQVIDVSLGAVLGLLQVLEVLAKLLETFPVLLDAGFESPLQRGDPPLEQIRSHHCQVFQREAASIAPPRRPGGGARPNRA